MNARQTTRRGKQAKSRPQTAPSLRFSPTAWAKLLFLRDYGETEVGGFGIAAEDDLLRVEDVQLVKQTCSWAHVAFDDESVADFFDRQVDAGRRPEQCGRLWLHSHPGDCPRPSLTDEETFSRVFGRATWAVMFIIACEGQSYALLRFNVGPGAELTIPVDVDYTRPFGGCDLESWEQEYLANVRPETPVRQIPQRADPALESVPGQPLDPELADEWTEFWPDDMENHDYAENQEEVKGVTT